MQTVLEEISCGHSRAGEAVNEYRLHFALDEVSHHHVEGQCLFWRGPRQAYEVDQWID